MNEIKELDQAGIDMMAVFEGRVLHPYLDSAGICTIGIGMTYYPETGKKVTMKDPPLKSNAEADRQFLLMAKHFAFAVYSVTRDDINQHQFNALFSLCYNIGDGGFKGSTVLKRVNQRIVGQQLKDAFCMWDKETVDGVRRVNNNLLERRIKEYNIYMS